MSGLFRRQCRGVLDRHGRLGLFWFGAKTLVSVVAAALYERFTTGETQAIPQRRGGPMTSIGHDLRYGARSLVKNPGFTLLAAGTLALGIGVNTTIFSLVNTLLFAELPITDPDTFGLVEAVSTESNDTESPATLADFALLTGVVAPLWLRAKSAYGGGRGMFEHEVSQALPVQAREAEEVPRSQLGGIQRRAAPPGRFDSLV